MTGHHRTYSLFMCSFLSFFAQFNSIYCFPNQFDLILLLFRTLYAGAFSKVSYSQFEEVSRNNEFLWGTMKASSVLISRFVHGAKCGLDRACLGMEFSQAIAKYLWNRIFEAQRERERRMKNGPKILDEKE